MTQPHVVETRWWGPFFPGILYGFGEAGLVDDHQKKDAAGKNQRGNPELNIC